MPWCLSRFGACVPQVVSCNLFKVNLPSSFSPPLNQYHYQVTLQVFNKDAEAKQRGWSRDTILAYWKSSRETQHCSCFLSESCRAPSGSSEGPSAFLRAKLFFFLDSQGHGWTLVKLENTMDHWACAAQFMCTLCKFRWSHAWGLWPPELVRWIPGHRGLS